MTGFIYPMEGNWTWGGGDVFGMYNLGDDFGFSDFAGSTLVHSTGGWAALVGAVILGARAGIPLAVTPGNLEDFGARIDQRLFCCVTHAINNGLARQRQHLGRRGTVTVDVGI